ncbi:uncharacterized protein VTP21DRAFT_5814 [Calcarisporiella thermophila]|uniref:uncharacterized protein n=1 Tax=Calcarisporiella thermophila TaxID=911321 RepID=UPI00374499DC
MLDQQPHQITFFDPSHFDLVAATHSLRKVLNSIPTNDKQKYNLLRNIDALLVFSRNHVSALSVEEARTLLAGLSGLLLEPCLTTYMVRIFRPILVDLVARWLLIPDASHCRLVKGEGGENLMEDIHTRIERIAAAFSVILPLAPQIKSLALNFFEHSPSLFDRLNSFDSALDDEARINQLRSILLTTHRLLAYSVSSFRQMCNWSPVYNLLAHSDPCIRFLSAWCLSRVNGLNNSESKAVLDRISEANEGIFMDIDGTNVNLRLLTIFEKERIAREQFELFNDTLSELFSITPLISDECWSPLIINLCGVLLPKSLHNYSNTSNDKESLVLVPTTKRNLQTIGLALSIGSPVLLQGVTGVGKTALVEEVARATGRHDLIKIHLGDQTDSKVLVGTYVATSTPGSFRWQPGVLTQAVRDGKWVLIEDIDLASSEVISVIMPLLETRTLFIPSRGEQLQAKEGFQLFATRSLAPGREGNKSMNIAHGATRNALGGGLWSKIDVHPLSQEEIVRVIEEKFPALSLLVPGLMEVFNTVTSMYHDSSVVQFSAIGRYASTRDLMKWCYRVNLLVSAQPTSMLTDEQGIDQKIREDIFTEAVDCFCGMISDFNTWVTVLERVGETLKLSQSRVSLFINQHCPALRELDNSVEIGRVKLNKYPRKRLLSRKNKRPFAMTAHALRLLERVAVSVRLCEPVLLVGETGTGKTTVVQHLADLLNQNLVVVNLSQQSDSSELLGGFKPVDGKILAIPLKEKFDRLFRRTFTKHAKNEKFIHKVQELYIKKDWVHFVKVVKRTTEKAALMLGDVEEREMADEEEEHKSSKEIGAEKPRKQLYPELREQWKEFANRVKQFEVQLDRMQNQFVFTFLEGTLVKAVQRGDWILLDEINLATTETLECLSGLLQSTEGSLLLTERGDVKPIKRHPNFRIFACMNPATDVGKRDLPPALRNRFTEFYVQPPDARREDLLDIVNVYLSGVVMGDPTACADVADFYVNAKNLSASHQIADGANQRPHFSIRTLARALTYTVHICPVYGLRRSLYEGFWMTFLTQLNPDSIGKMAKLVGAHLLRGVKNPSTMIQQIPRMPSEHSERYVQFGPFWLERGPELPEEVNHYIITPSVEANLHNLARTVMNRRFPVLIQGPTSSGKTSMIEYLARRTGHRFVRINNHEHTDLQEYLGTYVSNSEGQLVFQEGVLVEALRKGYWIVLDELNLAPSDVLEALNRLLDDNRELLIPETQEVVRPHEHFMLFATQNPAGLYGGRKALSRAFRNRFLELHFDDIPETELETILAKRCSIAPSHCKRLVQVYRMLMERRERTRIFEAKHGFITLRDMFRWAGRGSVTYQDLAEHGYMLLAERCRRPDAKAVVKEVIETVMKVKIDEDRLYDCESLEEYGLFLQQCSGDNNQLVFTKAMRRLFKLVAYCLRYNEPILLVGETGCGKTTVCQILAGVHKRMLHTVNCHQNTETADLLGSQRPVRSRDNSSTELRQDLIFFLNTYLTPGGALWENMELEQLIAQLDEALRDKDVQSSIADKFSDNGRPVIEIAKELKERCKHARTLFEWRDGPLVQCMREGGFFLLDEISLADDSVLERLNSVLEPHRLLVLAEKGGKEVEELTAAQGFQFLATMNPGGDYGKKELSPALRNRFTEIWVPAVTDPGDLLQIISERLGHADLKGYAPRILQFVEWFARALGQAGTIISLRNILSWVDFMNVSFPKLTAPLSFLHGACLVLIDGLGTHGFSSLLSGKVLHEFRHKCMVQLATLAGIEDAAVKQEYEMLGETSDRQIEISDTSFGIPPFHVERGSHIGNQIQYALLAPTTSDNAVRVLRAMQLHRPILLEGSPGVGKTSLISAIANAVGRKLVRINLSDQTDLMDLFGSDLPVEGKESGEFAWRDAPFLQAMQDGSWVLLDEINLASQTVLEGLNSCLDHRGTVYVPELDREFIRSPEFRVFAAQNPLQQGGGRKGLPKSFVNRFTQVYVEQLTRADLLFICRHRYSHLSPEFLEKIIDFNQRLFDETMVQRKFGRNGSPWEFNLRDVFRWLELIHSNQGLGKFLDPIEHLPMIYLLRMRTQEDREQVIKIYEDIFGVKYERSVHPKYSIGPDYVQVGDALLPRASTLTVHENQRDLQLLQSHLLPLETLMKCVEMNWLAILTGPSGSGKTSLVRLLARLTGNHMTEFAMNSGVDTMELLGSFEQVDLARHRQRVVSSLRELVSVVCRHLLRLNVESTLPILRQLNDAWHAMERGLSFRESSQELDENGINVANQMGPDSINYDLTWETLERIRAAVQEFELTQPLLNEGHSLDSITSMIQKLQRLETEQITGRFEWIDGALVTALEEGNWLLIDNANLCSPSVLDRLNPLMEPDGVLMVNERGLVDGEVRIVRPHPNFRLFMTVDPEQGELSRAMRNRGVEIALLQGNWTSNSQDSKKLINSLGLPGSQLLIEIVHSHEELGPVMKRAGNPIALRDLLLLNEFFVERMQRGEPFLSALNAAALQVYGAEYLTFQQNLSEPQLLAAKSNESLLRAFSPGNWPVLIDGTILTEESSLAMISLQGAFILHLIQIGAISEKSEKDTEQSNISASLNVAMKYFLECISLFDLSLRRQWIEFACSRAITSKQEKIFEELRYVFEIIDSHWLPRTLHEDLQRVAVAAGISSSYSRTLPLDVTQCSHFIDSIESRIAHMENSDNTTDDEGIASYWSKYQQQLGAYHLLLRISKEKHAENNAQSRARRKKLVELTPLEEAFAFCSGRITQTQLRHPLIADLAPLFISVHETVFAWIDSRGYQAYGKEHFSSVLHMLELRDLCWKLTEKPEFAVGELAIFLKLFRKRMLVLTEVDSTWSVALQHLDNALSRVRLASGVSFKLLWKFLHPPTLSREDLFNSEKSLRNLARELEFFTSSPIEKEKLQLAYNVDSETRGMIVDALATLYFIDEQSSTTNLETLYLSINQVHQQITTRFQMLKDSIKAAPPDPVLLRWRSIVLPLIDFSTMFDEIRLIVEAQRHILMTLGERDHRDIQWDLSSNIRKFCEALLSTISRSPEYLVSYRQLLWIYEHKAGKISDVDVASLNRIIAEIWLRWLARSWKNCYNQPLLIQDSEDKSSFSASDKAYDSSLQSSLRGTSRLFRGVETGFITETVRSLENLPIQAIDVGLDGIDKLKTHVIMHPSHQQKMPQFDRIALALFLRQLIFAHQPKWDFVIANQVHGAFNELDAYLVGSVSSTTWLNVLSTALTSGALRIPVEIGQHNIIPVLEMLREKDCSLATSPDSNLPTLGHAWVLVSMAFLALYIPSYPLDPTSKSRVRAKHLEQKCSELEHEINIRREIEQNYTGDLSNSIIRALEEQHQVAKKELLHRGANLAFRPIKSQLQDVYLDLWNFKENVLEKQVATLLSALLDSKCSSQVDVIRREELLQDNLEMFVARTTAKYPHYRDLLQPIYISIYQIKHGLRQMAAHMLWSSRSSALENVVSALLRVPSVGDSDSLRSLADPDGVELVRKAIFESNKVEKKQRWNLYLRYLIVVLQHLHINIINAIAQGQKYSTDLLETLDNLLGEIARIWSEAEQYAKDKAAENASLYKHSDKASEDSEEAQLQEMKKLFPDFQEEFTGIAEDEGDILNRTTDSTVAVLRVEEENPLDDADISLIGKIHRDIFSASYQNNKEVLSSTLQSSYKMSCELLINLFDDLTPSMMDSSARTAHILALARASKRLRSSPFTLETAEEANGKKVHTKPSKRRKVVDAIGSSYDFYRDENIVEVQKLQPVLLQLNRRVQELLLRWPDHMVLQNIASYCDRLNSLPVSTPIAKLLTGVELLLQKTEDWEAYASREVSIKSHQLDLSELIVHWRALEFGCWRTLLDTQDRYATASAFKWWLHLYNSLIVAPLQMADSQEENSDGSRKSLIKEILITLDQFLYMAPLGEFKSRLELVYMFNRHNNAVGSLRPPGSLSRKFIDTVGDVLANVHYYYSQFLPLLEDKERHKQRTIIERDLESFAGVAIRADLNIHALKQAAAKGHRQLHKCLRRYREALSVPVFGLIQKCREAYVESAPLWAADIDAKQSPEDLALIKDYINAKSKWRSALHIPEIPADLLKIQSLAGSKSNEDSQQRFNNLSGTYDRLRSICSDLFVQHDSQPLEEFAIDIITQADVFRKETPATLTDENKELVKHQKVMKMKALVELLRQLKRLGLRYRNQKAIQKQQDSGYIFSLPFPDLEHMTNITMEYTSGEQQEWTPIRHEEHNVMMKLWRKADGYFFRLAARMGHLREIASTGSKVDLSLQQIEKSLGFTEDLFSLVISERISLYNFTTSAKGVWDLARHLASLRLPAIGASAEEPDFISFNSALKEAMKNSKTVIERVSISLSQLAPVIEAVLDEIRSQSLPRGADALDRGKQIFSDVLILADNLRQESSRSFAHLQSATSLGDEMPVFPFKTANLVKSHIESLVAIIHELNIIVDIVPELREILEPTISYLSNATSSLRSISNSTEEMQRSEITKEQLAEFTNAAKRLIDIILLSAQKFAAAPETKVVSSDLDEYGMREGHLRLESEKFSNFANMLSIEAVDKQLRVVLSIVSSIDNIIDDNNIYSRFITAWLNRIYPFLHQHLLTTQRFLISFISHHKSLCKLTYVMCAMFTVLFAKGFCMPEGAEGMEGGEEGDGKLESGTGMGEGETKGSKDVSEQIEDEEQILGTQSDSQPPENRDDTKEEDNALEMQNDFDGKLEDIEPQSEDDAGPEEDDEDEKEEMEERMGDVDDFDETAIDDKMWSDDTNDATDESKDSEKVVDKPGIEEESSNEKELVAKDEASTSNEQQSQKDQEKSNNNVESQNEDEGIEDALQEEEKGEEEGEEEAEEPPKPSDAWNVEAPNAEVLDLPDNMNLDGSEGEEEEQQDEADDVPDNMDIDEVPAPPLNTGNNEEKADKEEDSVQDESTTPETNTENQQNNGPDGAENSGEAEENESNDKDQDDIGEEKEEEGGRSEMRGDGEDPVQEAEEDKKQEDEEKKVTGQEQPNQTASANNIFGVEGESGKTSDGSQMEKEQNMDGKQGQSKSSGKKEDKEMDMSQEGGESGDGAGEKKEERGEMDDEKKDSEKEVNPLKNLGDVLKEWKRRLQMVSGEEEEDGAEKRQDGEESGREDEMRVDEKQEFEFVKHDEDAHDTQVMADATEEQVDTLGDIGAIDEEFSEEPSEQRHAATEDINMDQNAHHQFEYEDIEIVERKEAEKGAFLQRRRDDADGREDRHSKQEVEGDEESQGIEAKNQSQSLGEAREPLDADEVERIRQELEERLTEWRLSGQDESRSRALWQKFETLTHDLAMGLCEQLRLILEPTLATKFKGDYRTGKRLNMKKIIPYIASQFKKDKIWLRRTKPSKREYQVMIAIDDSKSMSESRSVQLAYETLALMSKALSQLEVGDLSIVSFGETVRLLHPFEQPFTDEAGANVLRQFTFNQNKTYVKKMVETTLGLLEHARSARHSSSSADLWQLQLIVSDGICEEHESIHALVRRAAEQRVMIIFIVVDNKSENNSIMNMTQVNYQMQSGGKMSLKMTRYLDTFPFDYYVIVRDINALPDVLSDALQQYFSLMSG